MTNYNERLDEILLDAINEGWFLRSKTGYPSGFTGTDYPNGFTGTDVRNIQGKAKQAITSLIKELAAEARIDELQKYLDHYKDDYDRYADDRIAKLKKEIDRYE